ncbi:unnamed protein product [Ilex paraguariensis]|uniref:Uncharacterized protein n=1 Tax=Ilex paraguariensis TaxID=185542 RepID=A0ABC8V3G3_9AQUA
MENKPRDLSSHNGSSEGHSPVLNLSKGGGDHSGSEADHTTAAHDDVDDDVDSVSDAEDNDEDKDQGKRINKKCKYLTSFFHM